MNHSIILVKLQILGIDGRLISWIREFLSGRSMSVRVARNMCSHKEFICDVPQGTVLVPVLSLIYVNCIANTADCCWKAFADDFKLYLSFRQSTCVPVLQGVMQLQSDLDRICSVARSWNLRLNVDKCMVMRFGACNAGNNLGCSYSIDCKVLKFVTSHRDLGVLVDSKLRVHDHVRNVLRKAGGLASELLQSTICRSSIFMVSLFVSLIRPILGFCSNVGCLGGVRLLESVQ